MSPRACLVAALLGLSRVAAQNCVVMLMGTAEALAEAPKKAIVFEEDLTGALGLLPIAASPILIV